MTYYNGEDMVGDSGFGTEEHYIKTMEELIFSLAVKLNVLCALSDPKILDSDFIKEKPKVIHEKLLDLYEMVDNFLLNRGK